MVVSMEQVVGGIDHVFVPFVHAEKAFKIFVEDLGLPEAWPYKSHGEFASGGICLGNANLEIVGHNTVHPWFAAQTPAQVQGIVFTPAGSIDAALVSSIRARAISCSRPKPHEGELLGQHGVVWTNLLLKDFVSESAGAMLCQYHVSEAVNLRSRQAALDSVQGGKLGIVGLDEIVIGSPDLVAANTRWQRLLSPVQVQAGAWELPHGPKLRLVSAEAEQVVRLVLTSRSPQNAQTRLDRYSAALNGLQLVFKSS